MPEVHLALSTLPAGWKSKKMGSPSHRSGVMKVRVTFPLTGLALPLPTWPKFTAACWAEAVKITTVRYSDSFSLVWMDLGKPKAQ